MPPLSWNEIRANAMTFVRNWADASRERAEAQTFWNEFFEVFGLRRRTVAAFEAPVRNLSGAMDFIDLLWAGKLIAEHKSRGRDLARAHTQAIQYIHELHNEGRADEAPRYILVSDFARIALHDLEAEDPADQTIEFPLQELPECIRHFAFIAGYETRRVDPEDPANFDATTRLANLHDRLEDSGYEGHDLQRFMVRILFCLFAEDTGIFEPEAFTQFVRDRTREDGSDTGAQLSRYFDVLNTPLDQRSRTLDEDLAALPYVNGDLFAEHLRFPDFNSAMRTALLECCRFRWEKINPAIFGSLFQNISTPRERRQIGAHYTSERDILKLIRSLFLDELREKFRARRHDRRALDRLLRDLGDMRFLDPACGCGNFLVIAYRELRRLELDLIHARYGDRPTEGDVRASAELNVGQFYGIEIEEWPVRIAEVAMWLMDHQMNAELFERFGQVRASTPLTRSPHIIQNNALRMDWNDLLAAEECTYVLGNPPFVGHHYQSSEQKDDQALVMRNLSGHGVLDYVANWYIKAAEYIQDTEIQCAFVSTNSICQGEQAGILWSHLFSEYGLRINFGHRTFSWTSEARGRAHVHVVIVGFGVVERTPKLLHDYETDEEHPTVTKARNISPYLIEGPDRAIRNRSQPLCDVPRMIWGNKPTDGGNLILDPEERNALIRDEPAAAEYVRTYLSASDFLNGRVRYCLWLVNVDPQRLRTMPHIRARVEAVRAFRAKSRAASTRAYAEYPTLFRQIAQPSGDYLAVPEASSQSRPYIPTAWLSADVISSNTIQMVPNAQRYHFGVLSSVMHMAWVRTVCGRLKSDYRYSNTLVYNNFPWPQEVTDRQRSRVEESAQAVLDARAAFPDATLADLYDPNAMPPALRRAHQRLDRAVDACYRRNRFDHERQRLEYLFALYEQLTTPLTATRKKRQRRIRR